MSGTDDEDFAALLDASFAEQARRGPRRLRAGDRVEGTVVQIGRDTIFVDVGTRSEGEIDRAELQDRDGRLGVRVGDRLTATVETAGDRPRLVVTFARRGAIDVDALTLALRAGTPVEGTFGKTVKGGLEVELGGTRAFCPASQVDDAWVEDLTVWEGQTHRFKVIEVREGGRSIVVSRRAIRMEEREQAGREAMARLEVGAEVDGTVRSIQPYGAFVDLGGVEGLVHISELGHGRIDRVDRAVSVGQTVRVRILDIETTAGAPKIRLSMRHVEDEETRADLRELAERPSPATARPEADVGTFGALLREKLGERAPETPAPPPAPPPASAPRPDPSPTPGPGPRRRLG